MSIKKSKWYCTTDDKRELKRLALELGDLNQEEAFGRAVAALRGNVDTTKIIGQSGQKPGEEQ